MSDLDAALRAMGQNDLAPPPKLESRSPVERLLDGLSTAVMWAAGAGLVFLVAITGWLIWGRYVLNATPTWVEQVSLLLVVAITFLGAAIGVWQGTHLSVEMFREALPRRAGLAVSIFNELILGVFGGLMAWFAWKLVLFKWRAEIPLIGAPEGLRNLPLVICGALVALFCAVRIWRLVRGKVA